MSELLTTYTILGVSFDGSIILKYDRNGDLRYFSIEDAELEEKQRKWLYNRVPIHESNVKMFEGIKNFIVQKGELEVTFDMFYAAYGNKVKRHRAENSWKKMSKTDRTKAFTAIRGYNRYLSKKHIAKAHPSTYLNERYYEDEAYQ